MTKPEWGTKRACQSCGKRFYDLNRTPIACPQCGTVLEPTKTPARPPKGGAGKAVAKPAALATAVAPKGADAAAAWVDGDALEVEAGDELADIEESLDEDEDDSEDEKALLVEASDLDEDDVAEVKEHLNSPADE